MEGSGLYDVSLEALKLQRALHGAPTAYSYFDAADRLLFWNRAYEDLNYRIRLHIRKGAFFPDLLAELVVQNQIRFDGCAQDWVTERIRARKYGSTDFRSLSDGRTFLVQERRDEVGGTLGFWVNVSDLVSMGALKGTPADLKGIQRSVADQGPQLLLRDKLQTVISCLDLLRVSGCAGEHAETIDEATTAAQHLREILDLLR